MQLVLATTNSRAGTKNEVCCLQVVPRIIESFILLFPLVSATFDLFNIWHKHLKRKGNTPRQQMLSNKQLTHRDTGKPGISYSTIQIYRSTHFDTEPSLAVYVRMAFALFAGRYVKRNLCCKQVDTHIDGKHKDISRLSSHFGSLDVAIITVGTTPTLYKPKEKIY